MRRSLEPFSSGDVGVHQRRARIPGLDGEDGERVARSPRCFEDGVVHDERAAEVGRVEDHVRRVRERLRTAARAGDPAHRAGVVGIVGVVEHVDGVLGGQYHVQLAIAPERDAVRRAVGVVLVHQLEVGFGRVRDGQSVDGAVALELELVRGRTSAVGEVDPLTVGRETQTVRTELGRPVGGDGRTSEPGHGASAAGRHAPDHRLQRVGDQGVAVRQEDHVVGQRGQPHVVHDRERAAVALLRPAAALLGEAEHAELGAEHVQATLRVVIDAGRTVQPGLILALQGDGADMRAREHAVRLDGGRSQAGRVEPGLRGDVHAVVEDGDRFGVSGRLRDLRVDVAFSVVGVGQRPQGRRDQEQDVHATPPMTVLARARLSNFVYF